jgi:hypothetical protein
MKFGIKLCCHEQCVACHHDLHVTLPYHICWFLWCLTPLSQVSSTNKTDRHDVTEILLKVALSTIKTNIYDMARSHEGRDDKQHIVHGSAF